MAGMATSQKYSILETVRGTNLDSYDTRKELARAAVSRAWIEFKSADEYVAWVKELAEEMERQHKEDADV